jgi:hypothetical protein
MKFYAPRVVSLHETATKELIEKNNEAIAWNP